METREIIPKRQMILLCGISGSGKSTLARLVQQATGAIIHSTDDYFLNDKGEYEFKGEDLSRAHNWNLCRVMASMEGGVRDIIVDNTNTKQWEMEAYMVVAKHHHYEVRVVKMAHPTVEDAFERNLHGVPKAAIQKQLDGWERRWTDATVTLPFSEKSEDD